MNTGHQLVAYLSTLAALVLVFIGSMLVAALYPHIVGKLEVFGFGTITGGLIGLMRFPSGSASAQQDANLATMIDKLPPTTTGTGPAAPMDTKP